MTAAQARKFTFDLDLARPEGEQTAPPEPTRPSQSEVDERIAAARAEAFEQGRAEGRSEADAQSDARFAKATESLAASAAKLAGAFDSERKQLLAEASELSFSIGRKLAAHLIARYPEAELVALVEDCLAGIDHAPHLVVRCHPDLCEVLRTATEERIRTAGFSGRLVVMGDPEIALGDGRLEWVDGGLVRDINEVSKEINARIGAYLEAHGAGRLKESE